MKLELMCDEYASDFPLTPPPELWSDTPEAYGRIAGKLILFAYAVGSEQLITDADIFKTVTNFADVTLPTLPEDEDYAELFDMMRQDGARAWNEEYPDKAVFWVQETVTRGSGDSQIATEGHRLLSHRKNVVEPGVAEELPELHISNEPKAIVVADQATVVAAQPAETSEQQQKTERPLSPRELEIAASILDRLARSGGTNPVYLHTLQEQISKDDAEYDTVRRVVHSLQNLGLVYRIKPPKRVSQPKGLQYSVTVETVQSWRDKQQQAQLTSKLTEEAIIDTTQQKRPKAKNRRGRRR